MSSGAERRTPSSGVTRTQARAWLGAALILAPILVTEACGTSSSPTQFTGPSNGKKDGGTSSQGADGGVSGATDGGGAALDATQARPACPASPITGSFESFVSAVAKPIGTAGGAGSGAVKIPTTADRDTFASQVMAALQFDGTNPCPLPPSYAVLSMVDGADDVRIVAEVDKNDAPAPMVFWGTYAARRSGTGTRALVLEAPHPVADPDTDVETARVFTATRAEWFLLAGSHRCSNTGTSGCDGTTGVCSANGAQAPYRESDAAHSLTVPFYAVHVALSTSTTSPFLQLHANGEKCPSALVSDCSGSFPANGYAATFATAIANNGATVGRCGMGYPTATCTLCASENAEGRVTAGSSDACTMQGSTYGRFVHVEQQSTITGSTGDSAVIAAVNATFPQR
jgi:hypothetical protein